MKKCFLFLSAIICALSVSAQDCFKKFEEAYVKRGSYPVADDMHIHVIISYFEKEGSTCVSGKARVENGLIVSIFIQYIDNTYELLDKKFFNEKKTAPTIINGISEMIYTGDGEKFKIIFIDKLKPNPQPLKEVTLQDEITPESTKTEIPNCFKKFEEAYVKRGSYPVADDMHRNVIISYFEKEGSTCVSGKARVENGLIVSIFIQYIDNTYELLDKKFFNEKKTAPTIINGISEMIYTGDGEKFKIIFIDKLKPNPQPLKEVTLQDEITPESTKTEIPIENAEWIGSASGFFLDKRGYIATNYHVIEGAKVIQVEFYQKGIKRQYLADEIASDKINDLSILKIRDTTFKLLSEIPYVFSTSVKDVGLEVFTLGYPISDIMGEEIKFTDGNISSKTGIQGDVTNYQISVPIQPGNSGGPLFDVKGNLIGITSSGLNKEIFASENVNYAIKSTYLKNLIDILPQKLVLPNYIAIYNLTLTEKVKKISDFIPIIRVK